MKHPNRVSLVITTLGLFLALAFNSCKKEELFDNSVTITAQFLYQQKFCVDSHFPNNENIIYKLECGSVTDSLAIDDPLLETGYTMDGLDVANEYVVTIYVREICDMEEMKETWHYLSTMTSKPGGSIHFGY